MKFLVRKGEEWEERYSRVKTNWKKEDHEEEEKKKRCKIDNPMFLECEVIGKPTEPRTEVNPRDLVPYGTDIVTHGLVEDYVEKMERLGID